MKAKKRKVKKPEAAAAVPAASEAAGPAKKPPVKAAGAPIKTVSELISDQAWLISAGAITFIAAIARFTYLTVRPFHHDEGVNGFFLHNLIKDGIYKYDPANYHGPTLYYIAWVFAQVFGLETVPMRMSTAIFGLLMVVLVLFLKNYLGKAGSLIAALFVAISPGMTFISRYFIHEISFVFLSISLVVAVVFFIEKRKAGPFAIAWTAVLLLMCYAPSTVKLTSFMGGDNTSALWAFGIIFFLVEAFLTYLVVRLLLSWDNGRPIYLLLASASVALFFSTKETAFITLGTMLIACVCVWIWRRIAPDGMTSRTMFQAILAAHVAVILAALFFYQTIIDAYKFVSGHYLPPCAPNTVCTNQEPFAFFMIMFLAVASVALWVMFLVHFKRENSTQVTEPVALTWRNFREGLGSTRNILVITAMIVVAFAYICALFFTSFFTYAEGIWKAFEAYTIWTKTGNKDHTMHGWAGYLKWGMKAEAPIMFLSLLGVLIAFLKGRHRFAMFTALWAVGLFAAYSIIPYKTPWLDLSFILPMCMIAGYGLGELLDVRDMRLRAATAVVVVAATMLLGYQAYQMNLVTYDDDRQTYVYAHTRRQFLDLVNEMNRYIAKSGKGKDAQIEIVTPDYWPMTWYVKEYPKSYFQGKLIDSTTAEIIVAKKKDQDAGVIQKYANHYKLAGVYALRPGVDLTLLVRNDLADPDDPPVNKILEIDPK